MAQILIEMELLTTEQAKEVLKELPTTELHCTNLDCGATFNVLAYDPGKKYACRHCKSQLRPADDEDAGDIRRASLRRMLNAKPMLRFLDLPYALP